MSQTSYKTGFLCLADGLGLGLGVTVKSSRFFVLEILLHLNLDGTCNPTWELILRGGGGNCLIHYAQS